MNSCRQTSLLIALLLVLSGRTAAQAPENIGDVPDGNRSIPVHLIKLYDEFDHVIKLEDRPLMPFSPKQTCRKCHDYERIRRGWHFNAADSGSSGRRGEPWVLVDPFSATQIPLSYRDWEGTHQPASIGLSSFGFLKIFGRHFPGGGIGEDERHQDLNDYMRWQVSGMLEVNCQSCHNADPAQSQSENGVQVLRQNFRWAATAGSGFATVQGSAGEMPDNFDLYSAVPPEYSSILPPTVSYNASRFDVAGRVLFNVPREMPQTQCLFCHSAKLIDPAVSERWQGEEDVHSAAGMICVDCHRNGLDHQIIRGYEGEAEATQRPAAASFTCKGCHMGIEGSSVPVGGRHGAPRPEHLGIPPVHFERLTCTACHSGPWPATTTYRVKTSRAHALGIPKANKSDDALPHIATPVFAKQADGTYAPHHVLWPAFWAFRGEKGLVPVALDHVRPLLKEVLARDTTRVVEGWPVLKEPEIEEILQHLGQEDTKAGRPVYVSGGELYELEPDGTLGHREDAAAVPYLWPIAHDVRPKALSLGVRGCNDCHSTDAPFHFGSVAIASPYIALPDTVKPMLAYQDMNRVSAWIFSMSFLFRPGLKWLIIVCFLLLASVVLISAMRGLAHVIRTLAVGRE